MCNRCAADFGRHSIKWGQPGRLSFCLFTFVSLTFPMHLKAIFSLTLYQWGPGGGRTAVRIIFLYFYATKRRRKITKKPIWSLWYVKQHIPVSQGVSTLKVCAQALAWEDANSRAMYSLKYNGEYASSLLSRFPNLINGGVGNEIARFVDPKTVCDYRKISFINRTCQRRPNWIGLYVWQVVMCKAETFYRIFAKVYLFFGGLFFAGPTRDRKILYRVDVHIKLYYLFWPMLGWLR